MQAVPACSRPIRVITNGGELAGVSPAIMEELNQFLPPTWSHQNPIDIIGDASPERYAKSLEVAAKDPEEAMACWSC